MEQGLEVPAGLPRDASVDCGGGTKNEGARFAVNGRPETVAPVTRTRDAEILRSRRCRRRESFGGQQEYRGEVRFATD
jgi:hypothetical protein